MIVSDPKVHKYEEFRLDTLDGHCIAISQLSTKTSAEHLVVFAHGIFSNSNECMPYMNALSEAGISSAKFDFRGHGNSGLPSSDFRPTTALIDLVAVLHWAKKRATKISLVAISFGASVALLERQLESAIDLDSIVLLNPVINYIDLFVRSSTSWGESVFSAAAKNVIQKSGAEYVMPHFIATDKFLNELQLLKPYESLMKISPPTLILHGDADDKVSIKSLLGVAEEMPNHVVMEIIRGGGHGFKNPEHRAFSIEKVVKFIGDYN